VHTPGRDLAGDDNRGKHCTDHIRSEMRINQQ
jgi:hypothetical protein